MPIIGSEIELYQSAVLPSGVPRVMHEAHKALAFNTDGTDFELVPVSARRGTKRPRRRPGAYVAQDPVLSKQAWEPEEVDGLLLLEPSPAIDYGRIHRARAQGRPRVVATIYDLLPIQHPEWFFEHAKRDFRVIYQQILQVADHVVVNSHDVKQQIAELGWDIRPQIHVIPLGTWREQRDAIPCPLEDPHLVYVSTLDPRKGHMKLLDAYDRLQASGLRVRMTIIGRIGWCVDELVDRLRSHPEFGRSIIWLDDADDAQVINTMESATLAVLPTEGEGFGLFLEEGLAAGLTVVATDIPVFRERPHPNVILTENSAAGLEAGIRRALGRTPISLRPGSVRTMRDFGHDLSTLVIDVCNPKGGAHVSAG